MCRALKNFLLVFLLKRLGRRSLKTLYRFAYFIYLLLLPFPLKFKRTIYLNLSRCFPELNATDLAYLVKKTTLQTIIRMLEMPFFWFTPLAKINKLTWKVEGEALFKDTMAKGHGVLLLVPHLGAWEAVNFYIGSHYSAVSLYKPSKHEYQELLVKIARERFGVQMYPTTIAGIKNLLQALKAGKCAAILPDHDPGENGGIFVPFFGIPTNTTTLVAKLAAKSKAATYFTVATRLPKGTGFHLHFVPGTPHLSDPDVERAASAMNAQIAKLIQSYPEQYEWSYKRFRRTRWNKMWFYETTTRELTSSHAIGLIGGIATGKNTAAQFFHSVGIDVIDTDVIARELTRKGSELLAKIVKHFGPEVLTSYQELDRTHLRKIIFAQPKERAWLEALLHPAIRERAQAQVLHSRSLYCILSIPLLKRREDYPFLNKIIFIETPRDEQVRRLMARDQISQADAETIINTQSTNKELKKIADVIIKNTGTEAELKVKLKSLHQQLLSAHS
jgi:Kdo2-lipid IVA lauroyltransferase/acyltransferase